MPNWCYNDVTIHHEDPAAIERVKVAFQNSRLCMEFIPTEDGEWDYNFSVENWGTKWDVGGDILDADTNDIQLSFESAWSPPIRLYEKLVELGYDVRAMYYEPGMQYAGIFEDGEEYYYEFGGMTAEQVRADLPQELDECYGIANWIEESEEEE